MGTRASPRPCPVAITRAVDLLADESCDDRLVPARVRQIQDRAEAGEEPAAREHEEPKESHGDPDLTPAEREPGAGADRRKHDEDALEEDGDEAEHGDHHQRSMALRRAASQAL